MTLAQVTLQRQLRTAVSASGFDLAPKWGFSTAPLSLISPAGVPGPNLCPSALHLWFHQVWLRPPGPR